jgi:hypothetical protein
LVWEKEDSKEDKRGLWIIPLYLKYYDYRLDVAKRIFLGKKSICDIGKKGGKYGNRMYY